MTSRPICTTCRQVVHVLGQANPGSNLYRCRDCTRVYLGQHRSVIPAAPPQPIIIHLIAVGRVTPHMADDLRLCIGRIAYSYAGRAQLIIYRNAAGERAARMARAHGVIWRWGEGLHSEARILHCFWGGRAGAARALIEAAGARGVIVRIWNQGRRPLQLPLSLAFAEAR